MAVHLSTFSYRLGRQAARELIAGTESQFNHESVDDSWYVHDGSDGARFVTIQSSLSFVLSEREFCFTEYSWTLSCQAILPLSLVMGL